MDKQHWYEVNFERAENPRVIEVPMKTKGYHPQRVFNLLRTMCGANDLRYGDWNGVIRLMVPERVWFYAQVAHRAAEWGAR